MHLWFGFRLVNGAILSFYHDPPFVKTKLGHPLYYSLDNLVWLIDKVLCNI